jgi:hypothetical protein
MADSSAPQRQLGLVMIIKDENATIYDTLASVRGAIDYWTIVDTGSTGKPMMRPCPIIWHHSLAPGISQAASLLGASALCAQLRVHEFLRLRKWVLHGSIVLEEHRIWGAKIARARHAAPVQMVHKRP